MWKLKKRYKPLIEVVTKYKPKHILEIGTYKGRTACYLINEAKRYHGDKVVYYGIDLFEKCTTELAQKEFSKSKPTLPMDKVYANIRKATLSVRIYLYKGFSKDTIPKLPNIFFDLIFIDGGHSPETIATDWKNIQRFIHDKTIIIFDDYYTDNIKVGCKQVIDNLNIKQWYIKTYPPLSKNIYGDLCMVKVKNVK